MKIIRGDVVGCCACFDIGIARHGDFGVAGVLRNKLQYRRGGYLANRLGENAPTCQKSKAIC